LINVCINTYPTSSLELFGEIKTVKSILPYADKIKLFSPKASMILSIISIAFLNEKEKIQLVFDLAPTLSKDFSEQEFKKGYKSLILLKKKKHKTPKELIFLKKLENNFNRAFKDLEIKLEEIFKSSGLEEIVPLLENNILEFHPFDISSDDVAKEMLINIEGIFNNPDFYPLLDKDLDKLVNSAIKEDIINIKQTNTSKSKHIKMVFNLMERLPALPSLSIKSLLDIRNELQNPLKRFRSAIQEFSEEIISQPWTENITVEIENIYIKYVEPALADLEDSFKSNSYLRKFISKSLNKSTAVSLLPVIGIALSNFNDLAKLALTSIAPTATLSSKALKTYFEWKEKNIEIQKSKMFFYYKLKKFT
jgi:hypothetical protein